MAGHSKWANIKHRKGAADAKRGKVFTKLIREIQVAVKTAGVDANSNPRLRDAMSEARSNNMPKDTIERAIKRASGDGEGANLEEITYEGYGPGGVAILIESLTDNRNRTVAEVRHVMSKNGGNLGESGSVAWIFEKKGVIRLAKAGVDEDSVMELGLDAGAEDVQDDSDAWEVISAPADFSSVKEALEKDSKTKVIGATLTAIPKNSVNLDGENAEKMLKLMDALEDLDDVQKVYANFDIDDSVIEQLTG